MRNFFENQPQVERSGSRYGNAFSSHQDTQNPADGSFKYQIKHTKIKQQTRSYASNTIFAENALLETKVHQSESRLRNLVDQQTLRDIQNSIHSGQLPGHTSISQRSADQFRGMFSGGAGGSSSFFNNDRGAGTGNAGSGGGGGGSSSFFGNNRGGSSGNGGGGGFFNNDSRGGDNRGNNQRDDRGGGLFSNGGGGNSGGNGGFFSGNGGGGGNSGGGGGGNFFSGNSSNNGGGGSGGGTGGGSGGGGFFSNAGANAGNSGGNSGGGGGGSFFNNRDSSGGNNSGGGSGGGGFFSSNSGGNNTSGGGGFFSNNRDGSSTNTGGGGGGGFFSNNSGNNQQQGNSSTPGGQFFGNSANNKNDNIWGNSTANMYAILCAGNPFIMNQSMMGMNQPLQNPSGFNPHYAAPQKSLEELLLEKNKLDARDSSGSSSKKRTDGFTNSKSMRDKVAEFNEKSRRVYLDCLRKEKMEKLGLGENIMALHSHSMGMIMPRTMRTSVMRAQCQRDMKSIAPAVYKRPKQVIPQTSANFGRTQTVQQNKITLRVRAHFLQNQVKEFIERMADTLPISKAVELIAINLAQRTQYSTEEIQNNLILPSQLDYLRENRRTLADLQQINGDHLELDIEVNLATEYNQPSDHEHRAKVGYIDRVFERSKDRNSTPSEELDFEQRSLDADSFHPILTKQGYWTQPSFDQIRSMSFEQLLKLENFTIENCYGKVFFEGYTDLTDVNLDLDVVINEADIEVYPNDLSCGIYSKPALGEKLNRPAILTMNKLVLKKKLSDEETVEFLKNNLEKRNAEFKSYDPVTQRLVFKVPHFTRYAPGESDDESDNLEQMPAASKAQHPKDRLNESSKTIAKELGPQKGKQPTNIGSKSMSFDMNMDDNTLVDMNQFDKTRVNQGQPGRAFGSQREDLDSDFLSPETSGRVGRQQGPAKDQLYEEIPEATLIMISRDFKSNEVAKKELKSELYFPAESLFKDLENELIMLDQAMDKGASLTAGMDFAIEEELELPEGYDYNTEEDNIITDIEAYIDDFNIHFCSEQLEKDENDSHIVYPEQMDNILEEPDAMIFEIFGQLLSDVALHEEKSSYFSFKEFQSQKTFSDKNRLLRFILALEARFKSYTMPESTVMEVFNILFGYSTIRSESLKGYDLLALDKEITAGDNRHEINSHHQRDMNISRAFQKILGKVISQETGKGASISKKTQKLVSASTDGFHIEIPFSIAQNSKTINLTEQIDKLISVRSQDPSIDYFELLLEALNALTPHARLSEIVVQLNSKIEIPERDSHNRYWINTLLQIYCQLESKENLDFDLLRQSSNFDTIMNWLILQMIFVRYTSSAPAIFRKSADPSTVQERAEGATRHLSDRLSEHGRVLPATLVLCLSIYQGKESLRQEALEEIFDKHIKRIAADREFQDLMCRMGIAPKLIYGKVGKFQLQDGQLGEALTSLINSGDFSQALQALLEFINKEEGSMPEGEMCNKRSLTYLPQFSSVVDSPSLKPEEKSALLLIKKLRLIERVIESEESLEQAVLYFEEMLDAAENFGPRGIRESCPESSSAIITNSILARLQQQDSLPARLFKLDHASMTALIPSISFN